MRLTDFILQESDSVALINKAVKWAEKERYNISADEDGANVSDDQIYATAIDYLKKNSDFDTSTTAIKQSVKLAMKLRNESVNEEATFIPKEDGTAKKIAMQLLTAARKSSFKSGERPNSANIKKAANQAADRLHSNVVQSIDVELKQLTTKKVN